MLGKVSKVSSAVETGGGFQGGCKPGSFALFAWLWLKVWLLICHEKKTLFVGRKNTAYKSSEQDGLHSHIFLRPFFQQ